ncbi:MAG: zincin-like metallopeptidase domain-containing protein [Ruminobacter sp.]|nr:zincin-like metallopeptidase domain-containing protein [Ruminobacter sp.]
MNENITKQAKDLFDKVYNVNVGVVDQVKIPSLYVHEANKDFNFQVAGAKKLMSVAKEQGFTSQRWIVESELSKFGVTLKDNALGTVVQSERVKGQYYTVYNADQLLIPDDHFLKQDSEFRRNNLKDIINNYGVTIVEGVESSTRYNEYNEPIVSLPPKSSFQNEDSYYLTALHELAHSTVFELNRYNNVNQDVKAKEEIIAELASHNLLIENNVSDKSLVMQQSYEYISKWLFEAVKQYQLDTHDKQVEFLEDCIVEATKTTNLLKEKTHFNKNVIYLAFNNADEIACKEVKALNPKYDENHRAYILRDVDDLSKFAKFLPNEQNQEKVEEIKVPEQALEVEKEDNREQLADVNAINSNSPNVNKQEQFVNLGSTNVDSFSEALANETKEENVYEINRSGEDYNANAEDPDNTNSNDRSTNSHTDRVEDAGAIRAREGINQGTRLGDRGSEFGTVYSDRGTTGGNERESNGSDVRTDIENSRTRSVRSENDEMDSSRGQDELSNSYDSSGLVQSTIDGRRTDNSRETFTDRSESLGLGEVETNERKGNESIKGNASDSRGPTGIESDISSNNGNLQQSGATINEEVFTGSESRSNSTQQGMVGINEYESPTNRRNSENNVVEDTTNELIIDIDLWKHQRIYGEEKELAQNQQSNLEQEESHSSDELDNLEVRVVRGNDLKNVIPTIKPEPQTETIISEVNKVDFVIEDNDLDLAKGAKAKFADNVAAIKLLKQIESEERFATPSEQVTLSKYVGWGGLSNAFSADKEDWKNEYEELKSILTNDEYQSALESTTDSFYTDPKIINTMYQALENMGFKGGNVLEPSCGIGNFIGAMPTNMKANSNVWGVELDSISARIAKKLYPNQNIQNTGFQNTKINNFFDVAIGNVPFGRMTINSLQDKDLGRHKFAIHNYFFAKALKEVRPNGVIAFVTSTSTLDGSDQKARDYLATNADFLGAIRLPSSAFKANAGTDVVSDIIFLKKRESPRIDLNESELVSRSKYEESNVLINDYFKSHPEMILGTVEVGTNQFGNEVLKVKPSGNIEEQLDKAIQNIKGQYVENVAGMIDESDDLDSEVETIPALPDKENFTYSIIGNDVFYRVDDKMVKTKFIGKDLDRIKCLVRLADKLDEVNALNMQENTEENEAKLSVVQKELSDLYIDYQQTIKLSKGKVARLNDSRCEQIMSDDHRYYKLAGLEKFNNKGEFVGLSDVFTQRVMHNESRPHPTTPQEALLASIANTNAVDFNYMEQALDLTYTKEQIRDSLIESNDIYLAPELVGQLGENADQYCCYVTKEEYLSGDLVDKLELAKEAATQDSDFLRNVKDIQEKMPAKLSLDQIDFKLGSSWLPTEVVKDFICNHFELTEKAKQNLEVEQLPNGQWIVNIIDLPNHRELTGEDRYGEISGDIQLHEWGGNKLVAYDMRSGGAWRVSFNNFVENVCNQKHQRIYGEEKNPNGKYAIDNAKTSEWVRNKNELNDEFKNYIFDRPELCSMLENRYNSMYNRFVKRDYSGDKLSYDGINPNIRLKQHQKEAIERSLNGNTLFAHQVGAGKTFEMIASAMEAKRLGLASKSLIVTPKAVCKQTAIEISRLYPNANVLVTNEKNFKPKNRQKTLSRIANGNYDIILMTHENLERVRISQDYEVKYLNKRIEDLENTIVKARSNYDSFGTKKDSNGEEVAASRTIKELAAIEKQYRQSLKGILNKKTTNDVYSFEELGVDRLYIDEAHNYKNLYLPTLHGNIKGIGTTNSEKSNKFDMIVQYMNEKTDYKGVVFATGTPVSNNLTELFVMMRYLEPQVLKKLNIETLDQFLNTFGQVESAFELKAEGKWAEVVRLRKLTNIQEAMQVFGEVADIKTQKMLNLDVPNVKREYIVADRSSIQAALMKDIEKRAKDIHDGKVDPSEDNFLKITSDGRKLSLDPRLLDPTLPDDPNSKVNMMISNVVDIYNKGSEQKSTQIIFSDLGVPRDANRNVDDLSEDELLEQSSFNVYDDIVDKLVANGIPRDEIAIVHDANTEAKREKLFKAVKDGDIRIILGSTQKLGTGVNIQDKLAAAHIVDVPWRPSDMEQREGRIIRQGNTNKEVKIYQYVTDSTFDSFMYQTLKNKQKFISQIMEGEIAGREVEDIDKSACNFEQISAMCSGDVRMLAQMTLRKDVETLQGLKVNYQRAMQAANNNVIATRQLVKKYTSDVNKYKSNAEHIINTKLTYHDVLDKEGNVVLNELGEKKTKPNYPEFVVTRGDKDVVIKNEKDINQFLSEIRKNVLPLSPLGMDIKIGRYRDFDIYACSLDESVFDSMQVKNILIAKRDNVEYELRFSKSEKSILELLNKDLEKNVISMYSSAVNNLSSSEASLEMYEIKQKNLIDKPTFTKANNEELIDKQTKLSLLDHNVHTYPAELWVKIDKINALRNGEAINVQDSDKIISSLEQFEKVYQGYEAKIMDVIRARLKSIDSSLSDEDLDEKLASINYSEDVIELVARDIQAAQNKSAVERSEEEQILADFDDQIVFNRALPESIKIEKTIEDVSLHEKAKKYINNEIKLINGYGAIARELGAVNDHGKWGISLAKYDERLKPLQDDEQYSVSEVKSMFSKDELAEKHILNAKPFLSKNRRTIDTICKALGYKDTVLNRYTVDKDTLIGMLNIVPRNKYGVLLVNNSKERTDLFEINNPKELFANAGAGLEKLFTEKDGKYYASVEVIKAMQSLIPQDLKENILLSYPNGKEGFDISVRKEDYIKQLKAENNTTEKKALNKQIEREKKTIKKELKAQNSVISRFYSGVKSMFSKDDKPNITIENGKMYFNKTTRANAKDLKKRGALWDSRVRKPYINLGKVDKNTLVSFSKYLTTEDKQKLIEAANINIALKNVANRTITNPVYMYIPFNEKEAFKSMNLGGVYDKESGLWKIESSIFDKNKDKLESWQQVEKDYVPKFNRVYFEVPAEMQKEFDSIGGKFDLENKKFYINKKLIEQNQDVLSKCNKVEIQKTRLKDSTIETFEDTQSAINAMCADMRAAGAIITSSQLDFKGSCAKGRCDISGDPHGSHVGSYLIHIDGVPNLSFTDFKRGINLKKNYPINANIKRTQNARQFAQELGTDKAQYEAKLRQEAGEKQKQQEAITSKLNRELASCPLAVNSPYLASKGIQATKGVYELTSSRDKYTCIPFTNIDGVITTKQYIDHSTNAKRFETGGTKTGSFHVINGNENLVKNNCIVICEGYATGNSINAAIAGTAAVVVAGDCGNLSNVAGAIASKYPDKSIIFACDNDRNNEVNIGVAKAQEAQAMLKQKNINSFIAVPQFNSIDKRTDFNDLHQSEGLDKVKTIIGSKIQEALKTNQIKQMKNANTQKKQQSVGARR